MAIWIVERSTNGGRTWKPDVLQGVKVYQATAVALAEKLNRQHKALPPTNLFHGWRHRAMAYVRKV